jgi:hypothetical protein
VGLPDRPHHLEGVKLKLAREHFPLPLSLRGRILETCTPDNGGVAGAGASLDELLTALATCGDPSLSPFETIESHLESVGSAAAPDAEQRAILAWLDTAHKEWVSGYPLAQPLAETLQSLRHLAAAMALADPVFMQPGAHPLHRLLDEVVAVAIGWEPEVARSESLRGAVSRATEAALAWFEDREVDLSAVCQTFSRDSDRERIRARRMAQRVLETEQGRIRTERARRTAADMINECLAGHPTPPAIGTFLKGPWYASAQLVLLKFGEGSRQWAAMGETTRNLLDSLQPLEQASPERKQQVFEIVAGMPREMKRWLLSLQHDDQALEEAVGLVEFAHLKILRQQELELETISPIPVAETEARQTGQGERLRALKPGQWFLIEAGEAPPRRLRLRLSLNLMRQQELLFTDHNGLKALQLSYADFENLLVQRRVRKLSHEVSFSLSLARAAGVDSVETLKRLMAAPESAPGKMPGLPMGSWLGFHDGETPLLARVAVHDPQRDVFIFVNREGIKLREVTRQDLLTLMEQGQVEVLESRNNFQQQVMQARQPPRESGEED